MSACGVVGVGAIGHGLAVSLLRAGHAVSVFDLDPAAVAAAAVAGATPAASLTALAAASEIVLLALPDTPEIEAAMAAGLESALAPGSTLVVTSTVSPQTPRLLEARLAGRRVAVLDAPVSGGPERAAAGELTIMVGGPVEVVARCRPVLEALAGQLVHVGDTGQGEVAKLVNNLMGAVIVAGICEGLALAAALDADVERVCAAVGGGSGSSWILREWIPATVFAGDYRRRFSLDLMAKDMGLISGLAEEAGLAAPALAAARSTFAEAIAAGYGGYDFSVIAPLRAASVGAELPGGPPPPPFAPRPPLAGGRLQDSPE